jgi:tetratricopeptide (TPR) repeat protein
VLAEQVRRVLVWNPDFAPQKTGLHQHGGGSPKQFPIDHEPGAMTAASAHAKSRPGGVAMKLLLAASALALASAAQGAPDAHHDHGQAPQLGKLAFPTSCNAGADAHFQRGLGWLHSFEYEAAERSFSEAAAADPKCGIAYWGVAMSHYHPLWAAPSTTELEKGRAAVASARSAGGASERERDFVAAVDTFYRDSERLDHKSRAVAYSTAMKDLHERYPEDREAAVFYALSLIAAGTMDQDPSFAREHEAGKILDAVLAVEPDHPGVAHYLIHSFDYPPLAQLALPAARRYAGIAPASPHAQHMPSHIFVRLGLWDEAIKSNIASEAASRAFAKAQGLPDSSAERLHAMDYLAYGYLQTGQDRQAERVLAELNVVRRVDPPIFSAAYAATAIGARVALERRQWKTAAALELPANVRGLVPLDDFLWGQAHVHFARAVGAARSGDAGVARTEVTKLEEIEQRLVIPPGTYDWKTQVGIERQIAAAWLAHAEGKKDEAVRLMRAAADLDDTTEKHPVTPGAILPAREQLGELLLELGRPAEALAEYEVSLKRAPRRLAGVYGAARAAKLAGDRTKARIHYRELAELTKNGEGSRAEVKEARSFAAELAAR